MVFTIHNFFASNHINGTKFNFEIQMASIRSTIRIIDYIDVATSRICFVSNGMKTTDE